MSESNRNDLFTHQRQKVTKTPLMKHEISSGIHPRHVSHPDGTIKGFEIKVKDGVETIMEWSFQMKAG